MAKNNTAPGAPGIPTNWTPGAKTGLGKAFNAASEVTFTLRRGIVNEVYYPREDIACVKEMGLIVTDGKGGIIEEKTGTRHKEKMVAPGIPAYHTKNTCMDGRFTIHKEIIADPWRDTLLQRVRFVPRKPRKSGKSDKPAGLDETAYSLYVTVYPHIHNEGMENDGWVGSYKGMPMLFAGHGDIVMALACAQPWIKMSVGFSGISDGPSDILQNGKMTWTFDRASMGSIVLTAEAGFSGTDEVVIALGFGESETMAAHQARASLLDGFDTARDRYVEDWEAWQHRLAKRNGEGKAGKYFKESAAVLRMSESKRCPGGMIASLSIPWGQVRGDEALGGYHVVWPRDLVESAWGFLALRSPEEVLRILNYLMATQEEDGRWCQNMWLEGDPYMNGLQMDQIALPLLLMDSCLQANLLQKEQLARYWPGIRKAACFLIKYGPYSPEDRWEQQPGISTFTLAAEIAGLLAAAALAEENGEEALAQYCRETADAWNDQVEEWTYVTGSETAQKSGVEGFYVRVNPFCAPLSQVKDRMVTVKHYDPGAGDIPVGDLVCADALALVRFGLRAADDPRILNTVKVIDDNLKTDTSLGPCWRRFSKDAYGEDEQGRPYNGRGTGRSWPLLTGERAHYEIAAGHPERAKVLMKAMEAFSCNGFFPEQVWDRADIPERGMHLGKYTNAAMPLTWAHAEYIKLAASLKTKRVFDMPRRTVKRYIEDRKTSPFYVWRFDRMQGDMPAGKILRIELLAPALIHWTDTRWHMGFDMHTRNTGAGIHLADLPAAPGSKHLHFTFYWTEVNAWENRDFEVTIKG